MSDETKLPNAEEEDYEADIITLEDEDGREHNFEVVDAADINGERYLAVVPYNEDPALRLSEDTEMLIMRIGEESGEEYLDLVDDEEELHTAGQMFLKRLSEVYHIDMDDLELETTVKDETD